MIVVIRLIKILRNLLKYQVLRKISKSAMFLLSLFLILCFIDGEIGLESELL